MMENIKVEILHQRFQVLKKKVELIKLCRPLGQAFGTMVLVDIQAKQLPSLCVKFFHMTVSAKVMMTSITR